jgi:tetratricopeptide (TPR) repeat protein
MLDCRLEKVLTCCTFLVLFYAGCDREQKHEYDAPYLGPRITIMLDSAGKALAEGAFGTVIAICDRVIAERQDIPYCYFIKAQALTAVNRFPDAKAALTRVLELDPAYPSIWFNLGNNAFHREQYREALTHYAREWERVSPGNSKKEKCAIQMQMGRAHKNLGEIDKAISAFEQVIKLDENYVEVYNDLGHIYSENGEFEKALEYQMQALKREPQNGEYHYYVGTLLYQLGEMEKAIPYLTTAISKEPWYHGAHYNLGRALVALGQVERGQAYLAKVDSLQKIAQDIGRARYSAQTHPDRSLLWVRLGNLLYANRRYHEALNAYQVAHYLEPENKNIERAVMKLRHLIVSR